MDESQQQTPEEDSQTHERTDDESPAAPDALERAVAAWRRRRYRVTYQDEYLVQLVRRGLPVGAYAAVAVAAIVTVVGILVARRRWTVVSLTVTPDGQVITHRQRTSRPPAP